MNDDIIRMAREAGLLAEGEVWVSPRQEAMERFAALVALGSDYKVAQWMMSKGYATGHGDTVEDLLKELEWQIAEREREACAKLLDEMAAQDKRSNYYAVAARAIRARGQDPMPLFDDWGCPPCNQNCDQGRRCPNARVNR